MLCLHFSNYITDITFVYNTDVHAASQQSATLLENQLSNFLPQNVTQDRRNQQLSIKMNLNIALDLRLLLVISNPSTMFKNQTESSRDTNSSYSCKWTKADFVRWLGMCGWQLQKVYVWHVGGWHYCQLSSISIRAPAAVSLGMLLQATSSSQYSAIVKTG